MSGTLYIVSTPIGNLDDISRRAIAVLGEVDWVAAEDTRHSQRMLEQLGIRSRLISCHDHNESARSEELVARLQSGEQGALISDAGTPLVSDPGYRLVRACHQADVRVVPIPGASALLAALAAAGQPSDRFLFEGFVPAKGAPRQQAIERLAKLSATSIIYEAPHRVLSFLEALKASVEKDREISLCRELTKQFETIRMGTVADICDWVASDRNQQRGELVLVLSPAAQTADWSEQDQALAKSLLAELPVSRVAKIMAAHTGLKRQAVYALLEGMGKEN
ncbi:MAG: 16S rRNA (cytidine(1402)-2'-O)-methyltransferase [Alcanivorax sp.]|jgi:16S rRNA (cytidine1402-2'-O)-methyltransferase|uniref:16S rRNA (cytidine(1402)-2'-O)-methyltransferase n=1 Tax=Alcanivorax TaxID=59753 RepID=UPI000C40A3E1|nr:MULTISPECIES: 16S rRNA (cytidine(1402)-2'-O)-methyltransferase [Alcanivorax]MAC14934.1 16S rRNA (cytidine(1402)-2'-O)-methyltransferase [Alcanivorax sp.]MBG32249.1 16S rRNA (cytidine(1402)-2'-O)-methyltransferase [Alcanivorax sp.]|tara:strand:- start:294 stop:1130 length:837 start_codon:yes stop_codon:yes gene_type:complete